MIQRWMTKFLKVVFVVSTACFLLIQIHVRWRSSFENYQIHYVVDESDNSQTAVVRQDGKLQREPSLPIDKNAMTVADYRNGKDDVVVGLVTDHHHSDGDGEAAGKVRPPPSFDHDNKDDAVAAKRNLNLTTFILKSISAKPSRHYKMPGVDEIRRSVEYNNANAVVLNDEDFPGEIAYVVVVQVHNRPKYLEKLIQSISKAANVSRILLIFSHDYFSREIDNLVQSIKFCRVMQIFYPYSMQIYPDRFPGQDPRDCPPKIGKQKAEDIECLNWKNPDKYGNYRVAKYSQVKHHWWWKINYVFDGIARLKSYTDWVLLLEEDHYVSPDFLYVFEQIIRRKKVLCDACSIISLGLYLKKYDDYAGDTEKLCVFPWFSSRHNMGMAFNRDTWTRIHDCSKEFCYFDDYNWDWSLMHVNLKCLKRPPFRVIFAKAPRVFHIGDCGIHHAGKECTADASADKYAQILASASRCLFPAELTVVEQSAKTLKAPKENGGWGDARDHQLCLRHANVVV